MKMKVMFNQTYIVNPENLTKSEFLLTHKNHIISSAKLL